MCAEANQRLMQKVRAVAGPYLTEFEPLTSIPIEFWAALTANESGVHIARGIAPADFPPRFEPAMFYALKAVRDGQKPRWGSITTIDLAGMSDELIKMSASSWGFTQVMGYHTLRFGSLDKLRAPESHYHIAAEVMAEFTDRFLLDPTKDFEEMAHCWNGGHPTAQTADPNYTANLLLRMDLYKELK